MCGNAVDVGDVVALDDDTPLVGTLESRDHFNSVDLPDPDGPRTA